MMRKFHSGYFLSLSGGKFNASQFSKKCIKKSDLKLIPSNYKGSNYEIEWVYSNYWNGLEFIICSENEEIAQDVLFNIYCSESVFNGSNSMSEPHNPFEYGTDLSSIQVSNNWLKQVKGYNSTLVPNYFYLTAKASFDSKLLNAIIKYQLSTDIYHREYMDLDDIIDWKTTNSHYIQMKFAYAIITAYAVIEELGLEVRLPKGEKRSILENGEWNPVVLKSLINRLKEANVNLDNHFLWLNRGVDTEIEKKHPIKTLKRVLTDASRINEEYYAFMKDGYVYLPDAINHLSYLRSRISSHSVGKRIMNISVFDVANAQLLARQLIIESLGISDLFQ